MTHLFIFISVGLLVIFNLSYNLYYPKKYKKQIREQFGKEREEEFSLCNQHYYQTLTFDPLKMIDNQTWQDLQMDEVINKLNHTQSFIGEAYLYASLHQLMSEEELNQRTENIEYFKYHPNHRVEIQYLLSQIGKGENIFIEDLPERLSHITLHGKPFFYFLAYLPLLFLFLIFINSDIGIVLLLLSLAVNVVFYLYANLKISPIEYLLSYGSIMIKQSKKILSYLDPHSSLYQSLNLEISSFIAILPKFSGVISIPTYELTLFPIYLLRIFTLKAARSFFYIQKYILLYRQQYLNIYALLGEIECAIALASYLESCDYYSIPVLSSQLSFQEVTHPLLKHGIANDIVIKKPMMLTGSNASGKSTFLKAIGINLILAQTWHFVLAKKVEYCPMLVVSSIAVQDHLLEGESYFVAEIKSLKRLLDLIEKSPCFFLIDEILRGTNTKERIIASQSICYYLYTQNTLGIVATHDLELTKLTYFKQYHFEETIRNNTIYFDYKIKEGACASQNALQLLKLYNFNKIILEHINKLQNCDKIEKGD